MLRRSIVAEKLAVAQRAPLRLGRATLLRALCVCCLGSVASACTDPVFTHDVTGEAGVDAATPNGLPADPGRAEGGVPSCGSACDEEAGALSGPSDEAGAAEAGAELGPDAGLDEVRAKWVGRYAARSAVFSFDDPVKSSGRLLSIVTIAATDAGGLSLHEELCYYEGGASFLFTAQLQYRFVNSHVESALLYDKNGFESELAKVRIGYGPMPSDCRSGATLPKRDEQVWLTSNCDCPRSDELPPTSARDCRMTDQEGDGKAGATFTAAVETYSVLYRTAQEERIRLLNGYRVGERLYAERVFEDTTHILDCTINGTPTPASSCPSGTNPRPCASTHNKVELALEDGEPYTCAQVIAQEQGIFLKELPDYPLGCPAELAGSLRPRTLSP